MDGHKDWNDIAVESGAAAVRQRFDTGLGEKRSDDGLQTITARELQTLELPRVKFVVPGLIPVGVTILAGKPKIGKSWMALTWALDVASDPSEAGAVLYLGLEDNRRRLQDRMKKLSPGAAGWPANLHLGTALPRLDRGGLDQLRRWILMARNPRLIVIDTLACVRASSSGKELSYQADYAAIGPLHALAHEFSLAIIIVHHLRKLESSDPLDMVSGTTGLTGAADTVLVLNRGSRGATLFGRGRDLEETEVAVEFDGPAGRWEFLGAAATVRRSSERTAIINVLAASGEPLGPEAIATMLGERPGNIRQLLSNMVKDGDVVRAVRGAYGLPDDLMTS